MIKLYKRIDGKLHYHEAWNNNGEITVHWGEVGTQGQSRTVKVKFWQKPDAVIEKELFSARSEGYKEIEFDDQAALLVQYQVNGFGSEGDLEKRYAVENLLNEALGWTGNGMCDGGSIGSGTMEIFSYVVDEKAAVETTVKALSEKGLLDGAVIAVRRGEGEYVVRYPADHKGEFNQG